MRVYEALHPKASIEEGLNHPNQYFQARYVRSCCQLTCLTSLLHEQPQHREGAGINVGASNLKVLYPLWQYQVPPRQEGEGGGPVNRFVSGGGGYLGATPLHADQMSAGHVHTLVSQHLWVGRPCACSARSDKCLCWPRRHRDRQGQGGSGRPRESRGRQSRKRGGG